jgi:hypothetical protein
MSDKDFVVKNGLQVESGTWVINTTAIYYSTNPVANSTFFYGEANTAINANTANNADNLGGSAAATYLNTSGDYTVAGNITFQGIGTNFGAFNLGANVTANTSGFYVGGIQTLGGTGYYKGNLGTIGVANNIGNIYRLNSNTLTANVTILAGENTYAVGPISVANGATLTIQSGARVVIV